MENKAKNEKNNKTNKKRKQMRIHMQPEKKENVFLLFFFRKNKSALQ